jgi:hypothetical protein
MLDPATAGESGKAILHRLRSHAATRNVPAVLISKSVDCDAHDAALSSALDRWLGNDA